MNIKLRRSYAITEERHEEAGRAAVRPLRRVAAIAVVENPCAGHYVDDLKPMIEASVALGRTMADIALTAFGQHEIQSYGKGGSSALPASRSTPTRCSPAHLQTRSGTQSAAATPGSRRSRKKADPAR